MKRLLLLVSMLPCFMIAQNSWIVSSYDFSSPLTPGLNVLQPDSSNQLWQIGKSSKFDGVISAKPALYTDTLNPYPINASESIFTILASTKQTLGFVFSFKSRYSTEHGRDGGVIEISLDSGATWLNASENYLVDSAVQSLGGYGQYSSALPADTILFNGKKSSFSGTDSVLNWYSFQLHFWSVFKTSPMLCGEDIWPYIRFTFYSDSIDNGFPGWQIDEVEVLGYMSYGVEEYLSPIFVKPNPSNGTFEINSQRHENLTYKVYDLTGRAVSQGKLIGNSVLIDIANRPSGDYVLKFEDGTAVKLIKK